MGYTDRSVRKNMWIRGRAFRDFVREYLNALPDGSGGKRPKDLAEAFDKKYGTRLAGSTNVSPKIVDLAKEGAAWLAHGGGRSKSIRRADTGVYVKASDPYGYPEDFMRFLTRYASAEAERCNRGASAAAVEGGGRCRLKDVVKAFNKEYGGRRSKLGPSGARRMLERGIKEGRLQPAMPPQGMKQRKQWFKHITAP